MATKNKLAHYGESLEGILREKYTDERKTMREIADELGVTAVTIFAHLKKYGIKTRDRHDHPTSEKIRENARRLGYSRKGKKLSQETKQKMSETHRGKVFKESKYGGHTKIHQSGHIRVYKPNHINATKDGYVFEHILAYEEANNCIVDRNTHVVHHINGIKTDNRIENLQLMTKSEHMRYHATIKHQENRRTK